MKIMKMRFWGKCRRCVAFSLILLLLCGLLAACGDEPNRRDSQHTTPTAAPVNTEAPTPTNEPAPTDVPTPTDEPAPTDGPTPTEEPAPTEEPTPTPTSPSTPSPTLTPTPSSTPTATPTIAYKAKDFVGTWYSKSLSGLETDEVVSVEGTENDYRLKIVFDDDGKDASAYMTQLITYTGEFGEDLGADTLFTLKYSFDDEELELYRSWNYGAIDYATNPTDLEKGHLVFASWHSDSYFPDGTLIVADMQPDGTLKAELFCVLDNGSFPVSVSFTFTKPDPARGETIEDYLGTWYMRTQAAYYEDSFSMEGPWPNDFIVFSENSMTIYSVQQSGDKINVSPTKCELRTSFTQAELEEFEKWDKAGIYVWGEKQIGEARDIMDAIEEYGNGNLYMSEDGALVVVEWVSGPKDFIGLTWIVYSAQYDTEYMTYYTLTRDFPREEGKPYGSYFSDYVGQWYLTRYQSDSSDIVHLVQNISENAFLSIDGQMNAVYYTSDGKQSMFRPLTKNDTVPSWYKDAGADGKYTDYENQALVLRCTDGSDPDSLIILKMQPDETISGYRVSMVNGEIKTVPLLEFALKKGRLRRE